MGGGGTHTGCGGRVEGIVVEGALSGSNWLPSEARLTLMIAVSGWKLFSFLI